MANVQKFLRNFLRATGRNFRKFRQDFKTKRVTRLMYGYRFHLTTVVGACTTLYLLRKSHQDKQLVIQSTLKRRTSEIRFIGFASTEYKGQIFMTPLDFIESILETEPRKRHKRKSITDEDLEEIKNSTPPLAQASPSFFRSLRDKGIVSYIEYMFLLSILVKPLYAFKLCFKMFDRDNSGGVDRDEYLVMERIFGKHSKKRRGIETERNGKDQPHEEHLIDDEDGLQKKLSVDTTLMVHFFGKDGTGILSYEDFENFMLNLQREVLELEFTQFSHGLPIITEVDFARILLRYTYLDAEDYDEYIDRMLERTEKEPQQGITFEEFSSFINFLNNLTEFNLAMKYYTLLNARASVFEFQDAVKVCTGQEFSLHLVNTIFNIFDVDGDGNLSYREFIFIMKDRLHRGFKSLPKKGSWKAFRDCIRRDMLSPQASFYKGEQD
ncbi:EF-hand 8 domain containing protein [Asbolus verrucosus]|uniref:EF-hand 8 domain containing protein n=1 Tax=Asbolus verrucosus TaxID=1661398 RepID=A0A482WBV8_ASBVE|nr:EF-hand 8 domain containing protein [Asbolus verrucosus]